MKQRFGLGLFLISTTAPHAEVSRHALIMNEVRAKAKAEKPICGNHEKLDAQTIALCNFFCATPDVEFKEADGKRRSVKYLTTRMIARDEATKFFYDLFNESRREESPSDSFFTNLVAREAMELGDLSARYAREAKGFRQTAADSLRKASEHNKAADAIHDAVKRGRAGDDVRAKLKDHYRQERLMKLASVTNGGHALQLETAALTFNQQQSVLGDPPRGWRRLDGYLEETYALDTPNGEVLFEFERGDFSSMEPRKIKVRPTADAPARLACDNTYNHAIGEKKLESAAPPFGIDNIYKWAKNSPAYRYGMAPQIPDENTELTLKRFAASDKLCAWVKDREPTTPQAKEKMQRELLKAIYGELEQHRADLGEKLTLTKAESETLQKQNGYPGAYGASGNFGFGGYGMNTDEEDDGAEASNHDDEKGGWSKVGEVVTGLAKISVPSETLEKAKERVSTSMPQYQAQFAAYEIPKEALTAMAVQTLLNNSLMVLDACLEKAGLHERTQSNIGGGYLGGTDAFIKQNIFIMRAGAALTAANPADPQFSFSRVTESLNPSYQVPTNGGQMISDYAGGGMYGGGYGMYPGGYYQQLPATGVSYEEGEYPGPQGF